MSARRRQNSPESTTRQMQASQVDIDFKTGPGSQPAGRSHSRRRRSAAERAHHLYQHPAGGHYSTRRSTLRDAGGRGGSFQPARNRPYQPGHGKPHRGNAEQQRRQPAAHLRPTSAHGKAQGKGSKAKPDAPQPAAQLQSAVQLGNVTLVQQGAAESWRRKLRRRPPPPPSEPRMTQLRRWCSCREARASRKASGELSANLIEVSRTSGNADATGGVKATYHQTNGQQNMAFTGAGPVHVVADHAHLDHVTNLTIFFGKIGEPARLWQGSDSVAAPVLELSRPHATLSAHGPAGDAADGECRIYRFAEYFPGNSAQPTQPQTRPRANHLPERLSPPLSVCKAALSSTPRTITKLFSAAASWRRRQAGYCTRILWIFISRPQPVRSRPARPPPSSQVVRDRGPGRRGTAAAGPQGNRRRAYVHLGGWQVPVDGKQRRAPSPDRPGARNSNRQRVDFQ